MGNFIDGTFHRQDKAEKGHCIDKTYHRRNISYDRTFRRWDIS